MIEERTSCPLGSTCKEVGIENGVQFISKCAWLVSMKGTDASGNEHDDERCSMAWQPILQLEVSGTNRGINSAISNLGNIVRLEGEKPKEINKLVN